MSIIVSFLFLATGLPSASGESLSHPRNLKKGLIQKYIFSPRGMQILYVSAFDMMKRQDVKCPPNNTKIRQGVIRTIYEPIQMTDEDNHPTAGEWKMAYLVEHCEGKSLYNIKMTATSGASPKLNHLAPGRTSSSPQLQRDLMQQLYPNALQ